MTIPEPVFPHSAPKVAEELLWVTRLEAMKEGMRKACLKDVNDGAFLVRLALEKLSSALSNVPISDRSSEERLSELLGQLRALYSQLTALSLRGNNAQDRR